MIIKAIAIIKTIKVKPIHFIIKLSLSLRLQELFPGPSFILKRVNHFIIHTSYYPIET